MATKKNKQDPPKDAMSVAGGPDFFDEHHYEDPVELAHAESLGYDHRDIDTVIIGKSVFALLSVFTALVVVSYLTVAGLAKFQGLKQPYENKAPARVELPGGPLLQSERATKQDIMDVRRREFTQLNSYKSTPGKPDTVSIPVSKAIDEVAAQGLPKWDAGAAAKP